MQRYLFYFVLLFCFVAGNHAHADRLRLVVGGPNFKPYPIAVPDLVMLSKSSETTTALLHQLTETLRISVDLSRQLDLVPPATYLISSQETLTKPIFNNWIQVGASGLIRGSVDFKGTNAFFNLYFFDPLSKQQMLAQQCTAPAHDGSTCVYSFLDAVIALLTGEPGIFSSQLTYVKRTAKGKVIAVSAIDGSHERIVSDANKLALLPEWGPDKNTLYYTSYGPDRNVNLYRLNLQSLQVTALSERKGLNMGAALSPDKQFIALTLSVDGNTEIYKMDIQGQRLTRLTDSWGLDVSPTWSPDGKRIAFISSRSGNPHVYIMNADGTNQRRLTFQGNYCQEPDWSPRPDGQIAFTARDEHLKFDVFVVHPDTGEITRLTQGEGDNEAPAFSPDGYSIAFISTRGSTRNKKLFVMDLDGKNQKQISRDAFDYETPSWSPAATPMAK